MTPSSLAPPLFSLLAALGLAAAASGCRAAERDAHADERRALEAAAAVRLARATAGPVARPVRGTGVVRSKSGADLSFKVGGVVAAVLVDEGAAVKRGQVLARLDPTEVNAANRQARGAAIKAERDLARVKRLYASGAVAVAEQDNAETALDLARASAAAAAFNAKRATVVAPYDGRVDRRMIEPGEIAAPGRPVLHVSGRAKGAVVRLGVGDRDVLRVHEGDAARVVVDAKPDAPIAGRVSQIATIATPGAGTFDVEVKLDEAPDFLREGLTAKVEIAHDEPAAAVVPIGAIAFGRDGGASVFVVDRAAPDRGRARRVPVTVAFLADDRAALASAPFGAGAEVVEAGASGLDDGAAVRIVR